MPARFFHVYYLNTVVCSYGNGHFFGDAVFDNRWNGDIVVGQQQFNFEVAEMAPPLITKVALAVWFAHTMHVEVPLITTL